MDEGRIVSELRQEAKHCYRWSNVPRARYGVHSHGYRKILYVTDGSITFLPVGAPPAAMQAGDRIEIPALTPHAALVGTEGVVCWEGQAPE